MLNGRFIDSDGNVFWYVNDQLHRTDGPAIEWANGSCFWYINGQLHREDGPAGERADGSYEWCLYGRSCSFAEWFDRVAKTPETRTLLMLKWGSHT
jgi:hypothetical protein